MSLIMSRLSSSSSDPCSEEVNLPATRMSTSMAARDPAAVGRRLEVSGWVLSKRKMGKLTFVDLDDGKDGRDLSHLQVVFGKELRQELAEVRYHSSVTVTGVLRESSGSKQSVELQADGIKMLNCSALHSSRGIMRAKLKKNKIKKSQLGDYYPFEPNMECSNELARSYPHLRSRLPEFASVLLFRDALEHAMLRHFRQNGFVKITTPLLTTNQCEGGCHTFNVTATQSDGEDNNDAEDVDEEQDEECDLTKQDNIYLSVSGQLHLESVCSPHGLGKARRDSDRKRLINENTYRNSCFCFHIAGFQLHAGISRGGRRLQAAFDRVHHG